MTSFSSTLSLRTFISLCIVGVVVDELTAIFDWVVLNATLLKNRQTAVIAKSLMSPSGNGRKSLAFRRSLQVDHPFLLPAEARGLGERGEQGPVTTILG
jgi:hypothetical protein